MCAKVSSHYLWKLETECTSESVFFLLGTFHSPNILHEELRQLSGLDIFFLIILLIDTSLLNTQQYKVRIKGTVEQSRERSSALPYTSV